MKYVIRVSLTYVIITMLIMFDVNASEMFPALPEVEQNNYVIYLEGNRENRIELAVFDILDNSEQSLVLEVPYKITIFGEIENDGKILDPKPQTNLILSDNGKYYNGVKYYLDGDKWVYFESGYDRISENATKIIASNLPYVESYRKEVNSNVTVENVMNFSTVDYDGSRYVGTENFRELYISDDKIHYSSVYNENSELRMANASYPPTFVKGNDIVLGYVVIPDADFANDSLREYILEPIQIYDGNYKFIGNKKINFFIQDIVFYNGYFYCKTGEKNCLKTVDGNGFTDCSYNEYLNALAYKNSNSFSDYFLDLKNKQMISKNSKQKYIIKSEYDNCNFKISDGEKLISKFTVSDFGGTERCFVSLDGLYGITLPEDTKDGDFWYYNNCVYAIGSDRVYKIPREQFSKNVMIVLNDKMLQFSQPPVMEDDRTLVPMRFLFEQMGAEVTWDEETQAATATINASALGAEGASATGRATLSNSDISFPNLAKTEKSVTFSVDNTTATVNGAIATMDVPARLINDQTFVPLRFLSENLGYTVDWDEATNTAIITTE